jgi:hypothetical protein
LTGTEQTHQLQFGIVGFLDFDTFAAALNLDSSGWGCDARHRKTEVLNFVEIVLVSFIRILWGDRCMSVPMPTLKQLGPVCCMPPLHSVHAAKSIRFLMLPSLCDFNSKFTANFLQFCAIDHDNYMYVCSHAPLVPCHLGLKTCIRTETVWIVRSKTFNHGATCSWVLPFRV